MSSLKRYRQATENNAVARFRDLPPRFKRQKSIPPTDATNADIQKHSQNYKSKKSLQEDIPASNQFHQESSKNTEPCSHHKKILKRNSGNRPQLNIDQADIRKSPPPFVLSPMDNNLFNLERSEGQELSAVNNASLSWDINPFGLQNSKELSTSQSNTESFNSSWSSVLSTSKSKNSFHPYISMPETMPSPIPLPQREVDHSKDISEKDRRIIEMFKELERVADEKEKEEDEGGPQQKPLVSHHLRMLMCAIDKYTEGVDDEHDSQRRLDEAPIQERSSPSTETESVTSSVLSSQSTSPSKEACGASNTQVTSVSFPTIPTAYFHNGNLQMHHHFPVPVSNMHQQNHSFDYYLNEGKRQEVSQKLKPFSLAPIEMQPWDLWSSPSFNMMDVYSHLSKGHNSSETADSAFALFDELGMENEYSPRAEEYLNRTPLYKR